MVKKGLPTFYFIVLFALILPLSLKSQIYPADGSKLHFRLIGFRFADAVAATSYRLEIAEGNINNEDSFNNKIVKTIECNSDSVIAEVPSFGSQYTWRCVYKSGKVAFTKSALHHFSTLINSQINTGQFHFTVTDTSKKYKDYYIFLDDNKAIYDMKGNPVWFMPDIDGIKVTPRDLKLSPASTITFLFDPLYEISYYGDVLWKSPENATVSDSYSESFNHEFTRLANGHYMVLGQDSGIVRITNDQADARSKDEVKKMQCGTVIEYDENGHIAWSWKSSKYFSENGIRYNRFSIPGELSDAHINSFFFDEKSFNLYVGFKNISRIIKVKYPEGKVLNDYGDNNKLPAADNAIASFSGQHACRHSDNGYLYLYNNNFDSQAPSFPRILVATEPGTKSGKLKKIWEYDCAIPGININDRGINDFRTGGNVIELPDQSMFVCMSSTIYTRLFIVNRDKETLWSARLEKWNETDKKWVGAFQYRASICSREEMDRLIWNHSSGKEHKIILNY